MVIFGRPCLFCSDISRTLTLNVCLLKKISQDQIYSIVIDALHLCRASKTTGLISVSTNPDYQVPQQPLRYCDAQFGDIPHQPLHRDVTPCPT